ncbi:MAG TPA: hypothetical protein VGY77_12540 [Gemmataceae bacterium]|nr:hypothetical protein [Gemmataceae bacterium]
MNRFLAAFGLAWIILLEIWNPVSAQNSPYSRPGYGSNSGSAYSPYSSLGNGPYGQPSLSPYLNLRRGGNPAANYYLGVVPEIERRQQYNQFRSEIRDLENRPDTVAGPTSDLLPPLPETGHGTTFMNFSPYYSYGSLGNYFGSSPGVGSRPSSQRRR